MNETTSLFRPFEKLIRIRILGAEFEVPENNSVLRCLQYLAPQEVSYGRFCWNEDCQYCRITCETEEGSRPRAALACKLQADDGLRITEISTEIRYCLRNLNLANKAAASGK